MRHEVIEKSLNLMMVLIVVAISIGGLIELVPLMMSSDATEPDDGITVYSPLRLAGRDVYVRDVLKLLWNKRAFPFTRQLFRFFNCAFHALSAFRQHQFGAQNS